MLKNPQKRVTIAKTALVVLSLLMGFGIMSFWLYALGFQGQVKHALGLAATIKTVTFSADDALAIQKQRVKAAEAGGPAEKSATGDGSRHKDEAASHSKGGDTQTSHTQTSDGKSGDGKSGDSKSGDSKSGDRKSGDGKSGSGSREWAARVFFPDDFAGLLETRTLFGAPPRAGTPQANLQGILGDTALINGNWIRVGDSQNGIKLVKTLVGKVVVEIEGQEREVSVFSELPYKPSPDGPKTLMASMSPAMGGGTMSPKERANLRRSGRGGGSYTGRSRRGGGGARSMSDNMPPSGYSGSRRGGGAPDAMSGIGGFGAIPKGMKNIKGFDGGANNNASFGASNGAGIANVKPGKLPKAMRSRDSDMGARPAVMSGGGGSYPMDGGSMGKKGKKRANSNSGGGNRMGPDNGNMAPVKPAKVLPIKSGSGGAMDSGGGKRGSGSGPSNASGMRENRSGPNPKPVNVPPVDRVPAGKKKAAASSGVVKSGASVKGNGADGAPGDKPKAQRKAKNLRN